MKVSHLFLLLLFVLLPAVGAAQTAPLRPVTSRSECVEGMTCQLAAETADGERHPLGGADGFVLHVTGGSENTTTYRLTDIASGQVLCYTTKPTGNTEKVALQMCPLAEVTGAMESDFRLLFEEGGMHIVTASPIQFTSSKSYRYHLLYEAYYDRFSLFKSESRGVPVRLYRPAQAATLTVDEHGCATLGGDWTAEALAGMDWARIVTVDFSAATLPVDWTAPEHHVALTYVRDGQQSSLPDGWRNVAVLDAEAGVEPMALAAASLHWQDGDTLWLKYPIRIPAGETVSYSRTVTDDGGYHSFYLPFEVETVQIEGGSEDGEAWNVWLPELCDERGVHCRCATEADNLPALKPFLLRSDDGAAGVVSIVFSGGAQTLAASWEAGETAMSTDWELSGTLTGEHTKAGDGCYALGADGRSFVQALDGSHIRPFRMLLRARSVAAPPYRLPLTEEIATSLLSPWDAGAIGTAPWCESDGTVVQMNGCRTSRKGLLPRGIYLYRGRKILVP